MNELKRTRMDQVEIIFESRAVCAFIFNAFYSLTKLLLLDSFDIVAFWSVVESSIFLRHYANAISAHVFAFSISQNQPTPSPPPSLTLSLSPSASHFFVD